MTIPVTDQLNENKNRHRRLRELRDDPHLLPRLLAKKTLSPKRPGFGRLIGVGKRPDFLIIGTQKGGTTSLYSYLAAHRHVSAAMTKEVHYFDFHYGCGDAWYRAHFAPAAWLRARRQLTGEASPGYLYNPYTPERVAASVPDAKLIVMLRNPVERAFSHYQMSVRRGREHLPFDEALDSEAERLLGERRRLGTEAAFAHGPSHRNHSYLTRGHYAEQLEGWLEHFPREQLLVLGSERFFAAPEQAHAETTHFLGLPHHPLPHYRNVNGWGRAEGVAAFCERLESYFAPHNAQLENLLERPLWGSPGSFEGVAA